MTQLETGHGAPVDLQDIYARPALVPPETTADPVVIRASAARGSCRRELGYMYFGVAPTDEISDHTQMIFDTGNALESVVVDAMNRSGTWDVWPTDRVNPPKASLSLVGGRVVVEGYPDAVGVKKPGDSLQKIVEVKTRGSGAFKDWLRRGTARSHPEAVVQSAVYTLGLFGEYRPAVIATMNTDERTWETEVVGTDSMARAVADADARLSEFLGHVDGGRLPPPDYEQGYWKCSSCTFRTLCETRRAAATDAEEIGEQQPAEQAASALVSLEEFQNAVLDYETAHDGESASKQDKKRVANLLRTYMTQNNLETVQVQGAEKKRKVSLSEGAGRNSTNYKLLRELVPNSVYEQVVRESPGSNTLRVS